MRGERSCTFQYPFSRPQSPSLWPPPLTFDITGATDGILLDQNYGDRVTSQSNVLLPANSSAHISFSPNVTASTLILTIDTTGLGGNSDNVGLDNIVFSQNGVPEPASLGLLGTSALLLLRTRRK